MIYEGSILGWMDLASSIPSGLDVKVIESEWKGETYGRTSDSRFVQ